MLTTVRKKIKADDVGVPITSEGKTEWLQTISGRRVSLPLPQKEEISITDIAASLAKQCRFNGHCSQFYSVAEHSVRGVELGRALGRSTAEQRDFLLHDATEAYVGDLIRPIKRSMPEFQRLEAAFWTTLSAKFGLSRELGDEVHIMDNVMLAWEKRDLLPNSQAWEGMPDITSLNLKRINPWGWETAESYFLQTFRELFPEFKGELVG